MKHAFLLLLLVIGCTTSAQEETDVVLKFGVWFEVGQSNMVGTADADGLPAALRVPQNDVPFRSYVRLLSGVTRDDGRFGLQPRPTVDPSHGPEITFGRTMADAGRLSYLIKYAVSGSSLAPSVSDGSWLPDEGDIYPAARAYMQAELATFPSPYELLGVVWGQGETDAGVLSSANAYAPHLRAFRDQLRIDLGLPNLFFLIHGLHPGVAKPYTSIVRAAQEDVARDPNCGITNVDDMPINPDGLHFDSAAQQVWGERDAAVALTVSFSVKDQMPITLSAEGRNISIDARSAAVSGGTLRIRSGGTTLVDISLETPAFEPAGTETVGAARAIGGDGASVVSEVNPLTAIAVASGQADNYQVLTPGGSLAWEGQVTTRDEGGTVVLTTTSIALGQSVNVVVWLSAQPASLP